MIDQTVICTHPGCTTPADHTHHITYEPEVTVELCRQHHEDITIINGTQGRKFKHKLSNKHRWFIWGQWRAGKMKPVRTKLALEWIKKWDMFDLPEYRELKKAREAGAISVECDLLTKKVEAAFELKYGRPLVWSEFQTKPRVSAREKKHGSPYWRPVERD